jgi:hypothetical protein
MKNERGECLGGYWLATLENGMYFNFDDDFGNGFSISNYQWRNSISIKEEKMNNDDNDKTN